MQLDTGDTRGQLDLLATAPYAHLTHAQSAELFALKGVVHGRMGDNEQASRAFAAAVMLHEDSAQAWEWWGDQCDRMTALAVAKAGGAGPGGAGEKMVDTDGSDAVRQWAVAATTCVLNALRAHTEEEPQRRLAARALLLLSTRCDMVGATFGALAENVDAA